MIGYIYCLLTGAIVLILKQRDMLQERDIQARMLYGSAIAHEVINPLQGSAMIADIFIKALQGKDRPGQISQKDFEDIKGLLHPFKESNTAALKTVDRMLTLVRTGLADADDIGIYDIDECVKDALKSYGLNDKNLKRIQIEKENSFAFKGSKHFVGHVINNLICNALKYAGSESKIEIWYEGRELHFKDNGFGIAPSKLPHIFQAFDKGGTTTGTGVGLPFCKQVMEGIGGNIECRSTLGKGTEFILTFLHV
jgi:signal transduction histidine kinase